MTDVTADRDDNQGHTSRFDCRDAGTFVEVDPQDGRVGGRWKPGEWQIPHERLDTTIQRCSECGREYYTYRDTDTDGDADGGDDAFRYVYYTPDGELEWLGHPARAVSSSDGHGPRPDAERDEKSCSE